MISKGDLVKMRISIKGESDEKYLTDMFILGKVMNYCEDEDTYILEPRVISVPKEQVMEIETLPKDFDFDDVSMELSIGSKERKRETPQQIDHIRFSRPH
jgi:hypothetical protein